MYLEEFRSFVLNQTFYRANFNGCLTDDACRRCSGRFMRWDIYKRFADLLSIFRVMRGRDKALQSVVGQGFFDLIAAYGVSDGIFTFTEQAVRDVLPALR